MPETAIAIPSVEVDHAVAERAESARDYARASKADSTLRAYESDMRAFTAWCSERGLASLPADSATVAGFLAAEADRGSSASTINRRTAAIRFAHKWHGHAAPTDSEQV